MICHLHGCALIFSKTIAPASTTARVFSPSQGIPSPLAALLSFLSGWRPFCATRWRTAHLSHPAPLAFGMEQRAHRGVGCRCWLVCMTIPCPTHSDYNLEDLE